MTCSSSPFSVRRSSHTGLVCVSFTSVSAKPSKYSDRLLTINNTQLRVAQSFCYLGIQLTRTNTPDDVVTARLAKTACPFGRLTRWGDHGVRLDTKVSVYRIVVIPTLLRACCETWTTYRRHIKSWTDST